MFRLLFLIIVILIFSSCKKKCKGDCQTLQFYSVSGKIQNYLTHENIFYSNNPEYNINNFKIFSVNNLDTVFYTIKQIESDSTFRTSILGQIGTLFFQVKNNDIDTMRLNYYNLEKNYLPNDPVCCPNTKTLTSIYYNEIGFNPSQSGTIFYKKD